MAQLDYTVDQSNIYEGGNFEPIPAGDYKAVIDDSDAYSKENGNTIIKIVFSIIEGAFSGRKVFEYLVS